MPNVDSLNISISATAQKASGALDTLIGKLGHLQTSISSINTGGLNNMAHGINAVSSAMGSLKNVNAADFNRLANGIQKLGSIDAATITRAAGSINLLGNSIGKVSNANFSGTTQIADLAKAIAQLGYKSSTQAIDNIPKLAVAMNELITSLSKAPQVSQNVIDLTNALAKLARTGASSGRAVDSLTRMMNPFSNATKKAKTSAFSLASAIGKVYATYWLLFRAFGKIKEAMDISSQLTEVQNVVNTTFGEYSRLLDEMSKTSITEFGISELSVKKTASNFQAMGTAMGFTRGKMADMSIELTKLSADMASFYNVSQEEVAEDLQSVFTGMTRPLRQYGLDLTEATLKEWALKNGMDANIKSMSQAEKTMLRYQYVMANTGAAQGDFARTSMTWANQTRILVENFKALGSIIGGTFINAFKPLVVAINEVMATLIAFAETVSNSLGKIFGWQYEAGGSGGMTSDFEGAADSSSDIADSTGKTADNVEKIKKGLRAFDELKTISIDTGSKGSGGSGGSGAGGGASADGSGGQWVRTESIFEDYESTLDSLYKLGDYIGSTLTKTLEGIDWNKIYYGASNFGKGLADFLNGLISPELFGAVGRSISKSLNTALRAVYSFGFTFDWTNLGNSLANGINNFFLTFDYERLARSINVWIDGFIKFVVTTIKGIDFKGILNKALSGIAELDLDSILVIGAFAAPVVLTGLTKLITLITGVKNTFSGLLSFVPGVVSSFGKVWDVIKLVTKTVGPLKLAFGALVVGLVAFLATNKDVQNSIKELWKNSVLPLANALGNTLKPAIDLVVTVFSGLWNDVVVPLAGFVNTTLHSAFSGIAEIVSNRVVPAIGSGIDEFTYFLNNAIIPVVDFVSTTLKPVFQSVFQSIGKLVKDLTGAFKGLIDFVTGVFSGNWSKAWNGAKKAFSSFVSGLKTIARAPVNALMAIFEGLANGVIRAWNRVKKAINSLNLKVPDWVPGIGGKKIGFNLKMTSEISLPRFASGGFPEDGTFRASHGEIMGRFDNGKSVVANNKQITDGISAAVYQGNRENNNLLREQIKQLERQNELLSAILAKEGLSKDVLFESVRQSEREYRRMTGTRVFI
jgi:hypothetical protein